MYFSFLHPTFFLHPRRQRIALLRSAKLILCLSKFFVSGYDSFRFSLNFSASFWTVFVEPSSSSYDAFTDASASTYVRPICRRSRWRSPGCLMKWASSGPPSRRLISSPRWHSCNTWWTVSSWPQSGHSGESAAPIRARVA